MCRIEVHQRINQIIKLFHLLGLWHRGNEATVCETTLKWLYSIYYPLFPISIVTGVIMGNSGEDSIFFLEAAIVTVVILFKLLYLIWYQKDILELLHRICVYSIYDDNETTVVQDKQNKFMKYVTAFLVTAYSTIVCGNILVPFVGDEKKLFMHIGFPLDYNNSDVAFWIAFAFLFSQVLLASLSFLFSILMWYLMVNCAIKYEILGHQIKNLGIKRTANSGIIAVTPSHNLFYAVESHKNINELTSRMESFLSYITLIQIATSALCICGSIYCIIFTVGDHYMDLIMHVGILIYNICDIFMVMYFGNEIKLYSDRLSYCLFECNWIDQPQATKEFIIIFGERLKRPYKLVVGKLYPLTLETFQRILNAAYSMFNILQNLN